MTKKEKIQIGIFCVLCCIVTALAVIGYQQRKNDKIVVVDAIRLFNNYTLKKDMEARTAPLLQSMSHQLDSMQQQINVASDKAVQQKLLALAGNLKAQMDDAYQQTNQQINEAVWKRLNPLVESFGKLNGYHVIVGANGMGSVLYYDNYFDKTEDIIKYVNGQYENNK